MGSCCSVGHKNYQNEENPIKEDEPKKEKSQRSTSVKKKIYDNEGIRRKIELYCKIYIYIYRNGENNDS